MSSLDDKGKWVVVVIDADDAFTAQKIEEYWGRTPGRVNTRRGKHFLYRMPSRAVHRLQEVLGGNSSLKWFGLNADLKYGNQIVVAPPSRHAEQQDFIYTWDNCDPSFIRDLSSLNDNVLVELIETRSNPEPIHTKTSAYEFPSVSRGLELNNRLCAQAAHCESFDDLLDIARAINDGFRSLGYEPLNDTEVVKRSKAVWADWLRDKIEVRHNRRARASIDMDALQELLSGAATPQ